MREGNQSDKIDARRLAELLRLNHLNPVYHGEHGLRSLKELVRSYLTITKDHGRVMSRVKAIYRSWAIPCTGKQVYAARHRAEWLAKITEPGVRRRAEFYYQQLGLGNRCTGHVSGASEPKAATNSEGPGMFGYIISTNRGCKNPFAREIGT
jgi:hypothetical protein